MAIDGTSSSKPPISALSKEQLSSSFNELVRNIPSSQERSSLAKSIKEQTEFLENARAYQKQQKVAAMDSGALKEYISQKKSENDTARIDLEDKEANTERNMCKRS